MQKRIFQKKKWDIQKRVFEVLTESLIITYEKKKTRHGHKRLNYTSAEIKFGK